MRIGQRNRNEKITKMTNTLTYTGTLRIVSCWCGVEHAIPQNMYDNSFRQRDAGEPQTSIYCPLGHTWTFAGESKVAQVERSLLQEQQRHDQTKAWLRDERNKLNAERSAKSRIKNRVANGVCPCCNRSFDNLRRHMKSKHPKYMKKEQLEKGK